MRAPVLILSLLATAAAAEPRQHGNIVFEAPPDWDVWGVEDGTMTLAYEGPEDRCQFCYVRFGPGAAATGDLAQWLESESLRYVEEEDRGDVEVLSPPEVVSGPRAMAMMGLTADRDAHVLIAVEAGGRYELVAFQGWAYDEEEIAATLGTFQADVAPLVDSLAYVSEGAEPLLPEAVPGDLAGLWWGWFQNMRFGLDGMATPFVDHRRIVFWPDGRFYEGTPPTGLAQPSPEALAVSADWGTYVEDGATLTLTFVSGEVETLAAQDGGWSDESLVLRQVETLPDGTPLDGAIEDFSYTGFVPNSGVTGGISSESSTVFHPDGRYEGSSFGGAFGSFESGGQTTGGFATDSGERVSGGTYKVRDGLVVMRPSDGSEVRAELVYLADDEIWIGDLYLETE